MSFNKIVISEFLQVEELKDEKDGSVTTVGNSVNTEVSYYPYFILYSPSSKVLKVAKTQFGVSILNH